MKTRFLSFLAIILPSILFSQVVPVTYTATSNIVVRSDVKPKSVLLTNAVSDKVGDQSPVIGIAACDTCEKFECRSMLQFDLRQLPEAMQQRPDIIENAQLIIYPKFSDNKIDPFTFYVKRVWDPWTDSLSTWNNQPFIKTVGSVKVKVNPSRTKPLRIDVTGMVRDMLKFGNYGFMFSVEDVTKVPAVGEWFASPKNDDKKARPVLLINYTTTYNSYADSYNRSPQRQSQQSQRGTTVSAPANRGN